MKRSLLTGWYYDAGRLQIKGIPDVSGSRFSLGWAFWTGLFAVIPIISRLLYNNFVIKVPGSCRITCRVFLITRFRCQSAGTGGIKTFIADYHSVKVARQKPSPDIAPFKEQNPACSLWNYFLHINCRKTDHIYRSHGRIWRYSYQRCPGCRPAIAPG